MPKNKIEYGTIVTVNQSGGVVRTETGEEFIFFTRNRTNVLLVNGRPLLMGNVGETLRRQPKIGEVILFDKIEAPARKASPVKKHGKQTLGSWAFRSDYE